MGTTDMQKILVWDWPTRIGHWMMAAAFLVAYVTGESEEWRLVHVWAGGILAGIVAFRLAWGLVGSRYARFTSFIRAPSEAVKYMRSLLLRKPEHYTGHNPAGGWAIVLLLAIGLATAVTGWPLYQNDGADWLEGAHEFVANLMIGIVLLHIAGVVVGSLKHKENLPRTMITGYKLGTEGEGIMGGRLWAVPLLIVCALLGGWWISL
jgi:cytochrome b